MTPLPKAAGLCLGYFTTKGNLVGANTETGHWILINNTWYHTEPIQPDLGEERSAHITLDN